MYGYIGFHTITETYEHLLIDVITLYLLHIAENIVLGPTPGIPAQTSSRCVPRQWQAHALAQIVLVRFSDSNKVP